MDMKFSLDLCYIFVLLKFKLDALGLIMLTLPVLDLSTPDFSFSSAKVTSVHSAPGTFIYS